MWTPEKIRALRERHGMTQQSLAQSLGVSLTAISRWENGKHSPSPMACKSLDGLAAKSKGESNND